MLAHRPFGKKKLHNVNRIVIAALSLVGLLSDGVFADIVVMFAVIIWLWLPEWDELVQRVQRVTTHAQQVARQHRK
ncbi:hypothetical protein [Dongshaea marina]|uniref:hypothetical protein n=1 Tax=Dongshaea marina TaxID=2047966 RepID=UPI000D3E5F6B|nr:hypothetical protein [Dongshaea marina]